MEKSSYQKLKFKIKEIEKLITIFDWNKELVEESDQLDEDEKTRSVNFYATKTMENIGKILNEKNND